MSGTGWQAVHQEQRALPAPRVEPPLPAFDPGAEPYLPSFVGPTGDSRPALAPEPAPMFPVMGLQEPMPATASVETAPEPPAPPLRGIVAPRAVLKMSEPSLLRDNRSTCNRRRGPSRLVTSFHGPQAEFAPGVEPSVGCSMPPSDHLRPRRRSRTTPPCMATRTDRPSLRRTLRR